VEQRLGTQPKAKGEEALEKKERAHGVDGEKQDPPIPKLDRGRRA